ncbi:hypothetical protein K504DRAFT_488341 [Pleomassaria siparia CBS 279.74]|uniref:Uncharacterized protein n=1 Tax=Pleomassaria siparia CBS 279.74 TaxID=1314801 RepID=A0A6G1KNQ9_9PLEO|nr:hypothetical protein K504DRAFT_488341 [Pleomassaria siparia CBS 279.74]
MCLPSPRYKVFCFPSLKAHKPSLLLSTSALISATYKVLLDFYHYYYYFHHYHHHHYDYHHYYYFHYFHNYHNYHNYHTTTTTTTKMPGLSSSRYASKSSAKATPVVVAAAVQSAPATTFVSYQKEMATAATHIVVAAMQSPPATTTSISYQKEMATAAKSPVPAPATLPATLPKSAPTTVWSDMNDDDDDEGLAPIQVKFPAAAVKPVEPAPVATPAATPAVAPTAPKKGGLMGSRYSNKPYPRAAPANTTNTTAPKSLTGKTIKASEEVYTLPPLNGLSKEEYYNLVQCCAGKKVTESQWYKWTEGQIDRRAPGTWGART